MEVNIAQPLGFSQLGSRSNNEDTLFPDPKVTTAQQRWFMVCDGVGGAERGEVASQLTAIEFDQYFRSNSVATVTETYIQEALAFVQDRFDAYVADNPQAESMGTTLTLVYRHDGGITVAHLGDSRVYLIRKGIIVWRTDDHSYVNELVKAGVLSPDEARRHPQRNIITRAIQSGDKRAQAEIQLLNDLEPGDYLFMCTDGILERISDELLEKTLGSADSNDEKMSTLLACCQGQTRDNFTAYLIQVASITGKAAASARVQLPAYSRPYTDDDDDAVTLIGVPVPRPESLPAYASLTEQNDPAPTTHREPVSAPVERVATANTQPAFAAKPVVREPSGTKFWLTWSLVILLLGGGCFALWYRYGDTIQEETNLLASAPKKAINSLPDIAASDQQKQRNTQPKVPGDNTLSDTEDEMVETELTVQSGINGDGVEVIATKKHLNLEVTKASNGQRGLRWIAGKEIFSPQFQKIYINEFEYGLIPAEIKAQKDRVYISQQGGIYEKRGKVSKRCGFVPVQKNGSWIYLNLAGYEKLKLGIYKKAGVFDEKTCTANVEDAYGNMFSIDGSGVRQTKKEVSQ
ncbi:PP2C family protein-serine/threonine phosphatase [Spirosoma spitsbergense]|uniref:PP2C family protein-serine/threonine phosphatase n=1 Tax=Spirosoma spitsbergense TaxID=431554 RepID=UPI00037B9BDF|nr:protein phosphatase 2C domain-containing protein [Spirosoma spitsbergense]